MLFHVVFQGASVVGGQDADEGGVVEDEGGDSEEGEDGVRPDAAQRSHTVTHLVLTKWVTRGSKFVIVSYLIVNLD